MQVFWWRIAIQAVPAVRISNIVFTTEEPIARTFRKIILTTKERIEDYYPDITDIQKFDNL